MDCSNPGSPFAITVNAITGTVRFSKLRCNLSSCPECSDYARRRWHVRVGKFCTESAARGVALSFFTITSHEKCRDFAKCAAVYTNAWHKLSMRARRLCDLEYVIIPERHKNGRLHVHGIWSVPCFNRWLKETARNCGLGHQTDHWPIEPTSMAAFYITKYIGKDFVGEKWPKGFRRVRTSQQFPTLDLQEREAFDGEILIGVQSVERRLAHYERSGMRLLNGLTGEYVSVLDTNHTLAYKSLDF